MLYATQDGPATLIVAAADTVVAIEAFYAAALRLTPPPFVSAAQPDAATMLLDLRFDGLRKPPYLFVFADEGGLQAFVAATGITLMPRAALIARHHAMLQAAAAEAADEWDDDRPLREVLGLVDDDPWDRRSDAQKAQDAEHEREAKVAAKVGQLSGDSFAASGAKRDEARVQVTDIRSTRHADGSVTVDAMLAVKGLHDDNGKPAPAIPLDPAAPPSSVSGTSVSGTSVSGTSVSGTSVSGTSVSPLSTMAPSPIYRFQLLDATTCADLGLRDALADFGLLDRQPAASTGRGASQDDQAFRALIVATGADPAGAWFDLCGTQLAHKVCCLLRFNRVAHTVTALGGDGAPLALDPAAAELIDPAGPIAIYHRLDVAGAPLWHVLAALAASEAGFARSVAARGQALTGAWIACVSHDAAARMAAALRADAAFASAEIEVYGVNDRGERLAPKGIALVESTAADEPPRPWNDGAAAWAAMDDAARRAAAVRLRGAELIFCGSDCGVGIGCNVTITPRSYFKRNGRPWDGTLEPGLLPADLKLIAPATYRTTNRDWTSLNQDLCGRGMIESLALQLHMNLSE